ncbi:unnamed protein product [Camellia sinensis]
MRTDFPIFGITMIEFEKRSISESTGECELEDDFDVNGDNSAQLLAAANAANNAQAIITTLLEEYENIFYCFWR